MSIILFKKIVRAVRKQTGHESDLSVKDEVKGYVTRKFNEKVVGKNTKKPEADNMAQQETIPVAVLIA